MSQTELPDEHICSNCGNNFGKRGNIYVIAFGTPMDNYESEHCGPQCLLEWVRKLAVTDQELKNEPEPKTV